MIVRQIGVERESQVHTCPITQSITIFVSQGIQSLDAFRGQAAVKTRS